MSTVTPLGYVERQVLATRINDGGASGGIVIDSGYGSLLQYSDGLINAA